MPLVYEDFTNFYPDDKYNKNVPDPDKWGFKVRLPNHDELTDLMGRIKDFEGLQGAISGGATLAVASTVMDVMDMLVDVLGKFIIEVVNVEKADGTRMKDFRKLYQDRPQMIFKGLVSVMWEFVAADSAKHFQGQQKNLKTSSSQLKTASDAGEIAQDAA